MGIEPTCEAWKASVLPLNYARLRPVLRDFGAAGPLNRSEPDRIVEPKPKGRRLTRQARETCGTEIISPALALSTRRVYAGRA